MEQRGRREGLHVTLCQNFVTDTVRFLEMVLLAQPPDFDEILMKSTQILLTIFLLLMVPWGLTRWATSQCAMGPLANPSADGPAPWASPWAGPTWLGGEAVGSGAIGT